jgi:hypothetical protein
MGGKHPVKSRNRPLVWQYAWQYFLARMGGSMDAHNNQTFEELLTRRSSESTNTTVQMGR